MFNTQPAVLSLEQLDALIKFAARKGRMWKQDLRLMWFSGKDAEQPEGPFLRQIRNDLGPTWLRDFSFNKVMTEYRGWKIDVAATSVTGWYRGTRMGVEVDAGDVMALGRVIDGRIQMYPSTLGA